MDIARQIDFSMPYMFKYSPRPGTKAASYEGEEVPESVMDERLYRLQDLTLAQMESQNRGLMGSTLPILLDTLDKNQCPTGRTLSNKKVHVLNAGAACIGKTVDVEITEANASNLRGYYVGAPRIDRGSEARLSASVSIA